VHCYGQSRYKYRIRIEIYVIELWTEDLSDSYTDKMDQTKNLSENFTRFRNDTDIDIDIDY